MPLWIENPENNGRPVPQKPVDYNQLSNTLGNNFSTKTNQTIASSPVQLRSALILGSPEFMYK